MFLPEVTLEEFKDEGSYFAVTLAFDDEQIQAHKMTCRCLFPLLPKYPLQLTVTEAPCFTLTLKQ